MPSPPSVVLSLGLGVDSTAVLLRWLLEPETRDFDLARLVAVTAHTGHEWPDTIDLANNYLLPLLAGHGIRYAQVARKGPSQKDGIVVLSDTRSPKRLITTGGYLLADNLLCAGTVPQSTGDRRHSVNFKGVPLDKYIATVTEGQPYRHVVGFEVTETARAARDAQCGPKTRTPVYPLISPWSWDRAACSAYIRRHLGVDWPKSACTYCPFALTGASLTGTLARFARYPDQAVLPLLMEHVATALNPKQGLIAGRRLLTVMEREPIMGHVLAGYRIALKAEEWALYSVQRARLPKRATRRITVEATGTQPAVRAALENRAARSRCPVDELDGHPRVWLRNPSPVPPTAEWFYVIAPYRAEEKTGPGFEAAWSVASATPDYTDLLASGS